VIAATDGQIGVNNAGAVQAGAAAKNAPKNGKNTGNASQAGKDIDTAAALTGDAKSDIAPGDINKGAIDKGVTDKGDVNKSATARIHDAQNSAANDIARDKADSANSASTAELKAISAQATLDSAQAPAPKSAPPPMQAANANFDISSIAPQPGLVSASTQQDIQVSAKPAPNLPALAVEIVARSQSGAKQFDIRLDPPELGRVDIRLSIDATGKASAHLSADQPHTLTLLQNDASVLTRALRDAGLDVAQNGLNFSLRQQAENNSGNAGDNGRRGNSRAFSLTATADIDAAATSAAYRGVANGRLDIRV
jgi:flagellar hook-length control protein FliK